MKTLAGVLCILGLSCPLIIQFSATAPPSALAIACPAAVSVASPTGASVTVTYPAASASGGMAPLRLVYRPASGTVFPLGTTPVRVSVGDAAQQTASCSFTVTVTATAPRGPQSTIMCPAGAVNILPGTSLQQVVNAATGATTFCLKAGVHSIMGTITPKTGNTFVGEFGAILDGTGWTTSDRDAAAFRALNQDIDNVTIRNLRILHMPQRAIHAYQWMSDRWTIENNEIAHNFTGLQLPNAAIVRNNYVHHNIGKPSADSPQDRGGGYTCHKCVNALIENNEFAYNGPEQKLVEGGGHVFRNNWFHNEYEGVWLDGYDRDVLIESNLFENVIRQAIFYEISERGIIRNNTVRGSETAIFISTSKNVETYGNTLEDNWRGITYFVNCDAVGAGVIVADLANNSAHDNTIIVGTRAGSFSNSIAQAGGCTSTQVAPYLNGSKNLTFQNNHYRATDTAARYWLFGQVNKTWAEWRALGHDTTGTLIQR